MVTFLIGNPVSLQGYLRIGKKQLAESLVFDRALYDLV